MRRTQSAASPAAASGPAVGPVAGAASRPATGSARISPAQVAAPSGSGRRAGPSRSVGVVSPVRCTSTEAAWSDAITGREASPGAR